MAKGSGSSWRAFRPGAELRALGGTDRVTVATEVRILGLDPGSRRTGYALLECTARGMRLLAGGVIEATGRELALRLRHIHDAVRALVLEYAPGEIAIERVFVHRNSDSALKLGQARGAALSAAVSSGASAHEYAPRAIKLAVTGYGAAEKPQVAAMVTALLALPVTPAADAADAAAIALCHAQTRRLAGLVPTAGTTGRAQRSGAA